MGGESFDLPPGHEGNDVCDICGLRRWWHEENSTTHAFVGEEGGALGLASAAGPPSGAEGAPTPLVGDLILRMALVKAGVVTEQQLTESEAWVREAGRTKKALTVEEGVFVLLSQDDLAKVVASGS